MNTKKKRTVRASKKKSQSSAAGAARAGATRKARPKKQSPASRDDTLEAQSAAPSQPPGPDSQQHLQAAGPAKGDHDPDLLERARTQWQFGDWASLAQLANQPLAHHPDRARLALFAAAGLLQQGNREPAEELVHQAREWGCDTTWMRRILVAGVYNSLARARLLQGREADAAHLTEVACTTGMPSGEARLVIPARIAYQAAALGRPQPRLGLAFNRKGSLPPSRLGNARNGQRADVEPGLLTRLYRILDRLAEGLTRSGKEFTLDGIRVFETKPDPYLPGKLALGLSYRIAERAYNTRDLRQACREFQAVDELTRNRRQETWGIYFYLLALSRMQRLGVLDEALPPDRLTELRDTLDWRGFVDPTRYEIRGKPHNFYGVAFSIAHLRAHLGWDDPSHADILLEKMIHHYREYGGEFGFADETGGEGRYDRYSILLIAEIGHRFREAGRGMPVELQQWLRRSADVVLASLNRYGNGFQFGRSIGAYGDTAFLEVLSAAAWHGLLSPVESRMAYTFSRRATRKFLDFWYDDDRQAVNLWEDGRRTDQYRGKHRILGETLSLLHHHLYTHQVWGQLGLGSNTPVDVEFEAWLEQRPRFTLFRLSERKHSRALFIVRDSEHVFMLPFVNGGAYHDHTAYYPVPFSGRGLIQPVPDACFPQLVPRLELDDGTVLMPLSFMRSITVHESAESAILTVEQSELDVVGQEQPIPDSRVAVRTTFEFTRGCICRVDEFIPGQGISIHTIDLEFATDATAVQWDGSSATFGDGRTIRLNVDGYAAMAIDDISADEAYESPEGKLRSLVRWRLMPETTGQTVRAAWSFYYTT